MSSRATALLPVGLLALTVFWSGTFPGAATASGALAHQVAVLAFCLLAPNLRDPLDLGTNGRLLLVAALVVTATSWWLSPVSRAGVVGLTLLPAYLLLPSSIARCWQQPLSRRLGLVSLSLLTFMVCLTALVRWHTLSLPRASLPLGHHNLLAGWLVLVWPLALVAGRWPGASRWLAFATGAAGVLTMAATGSLLGALAIAVQILIAALWWQRLRPWVVPGLLTLVALNLPRLLTISLALDSSTLARLSYLQGGWQGLMQRPGLGWGPGAVPWTLGEFLQPLAGIHPASQVVGDLHSLPLQLAYEIGIAGLLLISAAGIVFLRRRSRELEAVEDGTPGRAALLGLFGGSIYALGAAPVAIPALPIAAAVVAGTALRSRPAARHRIPILSAYLILAVVILAPIDRAHFHYDRARQAATPAASLTAITRAREIDADFPLYRAREAWLSAEVLGTEDASSALQALHAAEAAPGLGPLWLAAGDLGHRADQSWAPAALARAQRLDPLSPLVAFHLMRVQSTDDEATRLGEFALSHEPRLAAALWWSNHGEIAARVSDLTGIPLQPIPQERAAEPRVLALTLDRHPTLSFSLYAFRRSPWFARLAPIAMGGG